MSIQTVEISLPESIIKVIEIRQGPAGASGGGSNSITSATTSDGTADLDLLNVTTATATVTGTLTADHIHGNLAGSVYAHVRAGENLAKGDPVYVSGSHGSGSTLIPIVSKADSGNAAKMPAIGIMDAAVSANANGHMVITGTITELNTNAYTVNAELYVASGGGLTDTPPSARAQPVARVERVNTNNGAIIVKVNGLSASDATANTLVRRTSDGSASFSSATFSGLLDAGDFTANGSTGELIFGSGSQIIFDGISYTYGTGAASAHRIALGAGTTGAELFQAATAAAARTTLGLYQIASTTTTAAAAAAGRVATPLTLTLPAGFYRLEMSTYFTNGGTGASGLYELELSGANAGWAINERHGNVLAANVAGRLIPASTTVGAFGTTQNQSGTDSVGAWWNLNLSAQTTITVTVRNTAASGTTTHLSGSLVAQKII